LENGYELIFFEGFSGFMEERILLNGQELIINEDRIQLKDGIVNGVINTPVQFRFGIQPIDFFPITYGNLYRIDLKDEIDRVLSIQLSSYLKIKEKQKLAKYEFILERLWERFFKDRLNGYKVSLNNGEVVDLGKFHVHKEWIKKDRGGPPMDIKVELESAVIIRNWDKLFIRSKFDREHYIKVDILKEWNSPFIYSLLDSIMGEQTKTHSPI
jgi:hypothetical protein